MHNTSRLAVLIAATCLPATASELGILIDRQFSQPVLYSDLHTTAFRTNGFALRGAFTWFDLKGVELGMTATYHPSAKGNTDLLVGSNSLWLGTPKIRTKYAAVGFQANLKDILDLQLGIEARQETVSMDDGPLIVSSIVPPQTLFLRAEPGRTTFVRPWATVGVGISKPAPVITPFIRFEFAYALKTFSELSPYQNANGDDFRRRLAPTYQVALYGGIRF